MIVSYINTSIEVKAESDILCTSRNAVKDRQFHSRRKSRSSSCPTATWAITCKRQTGRENMQIWQGTCIVHATFPARRVAEAKAEHPDAKVVAHPECPESVLATGGFHRLHLAPSSNGAPRQRRARIHRDDRKRHPVLAGQTAPRKRFYFVANENCNCSECPYMKLNTLEKLRDCLLNLEPRVELSAEIMQRALAPLERMLAVK